MKFMKKYKIHVCSRETNANCERTLVTPCQICYNEPIFEVTPHNGDLLCVCVKLATVEKLLAGQD